MLLLFDLAKLLFLISLICCCFWSCKVVVDFDHAKLLCICLFMILFSLPQVCSDQAKFLTVLDQRRANNILIEIKRFPAARHIKTAILSMDYSYFNKEMVEVRRQLVCSIVCVWCVYGMHTNHCCTHVRCCGVYYIPYSEWPTAYVACTLLHALLCHILRAPLPPPPLTSSPHLLPSPPPPPLTTSSSPNHLLPLP